MRLLEEISSRGLCEFGHQESTWFERISFHSEVRAPSKRRKFASYFESARGVRSDTAIAVSIPTQEWPGACLTPGASDPRPGDSPFETMAPGPA
jgi:hypothetical protein